MKIEKVNENQIRCTLTKEDLATRKLKISELAYGTQKAKDLFRDMMRQASFEFGFEAEDIPLMIEAIPLQESVVLIITKVEDPEELDTRFSKFAPSVHEAEEESEDEYEEIAEETTSKDNNSSILDLFRRIRASCDEVLERAEQNNAVVSKDAKNLCQLFSFNSLNEVIQVAHLMCDKFDGPNDLYKDEVTGEYILIVHQGNHSVEEFAKVCNLLSEYAQTIKVVPSVESYLEEHYDLVISGNALLSLSHV